MNNELNKNANKKWRVWLLLGVSAACALFLLWHGPISQDTSYHNFIDARTLLGVTNFGNVISNLPFTVVGSMGMFYCWKKRKTNDMTVPVFWFFLGICLTGFGSAYYHFLPNNQSLVWDRLPMTLAFMAFSSFIIDEYIKKGLGLQLLPYFLMTGVGSVIYWAVTETLGQGDLRIYILVQFLPMLLFPITLCLFESKTYKRKDMFWFLLFYLIAKLFEFFDQQIFELGYVISGHSVKHICAALGVYWFLVVLQKRNCVL